MQLAATATATATATRPDLPPISIVIRPEPNLTRDPGCELLASVRSEFQDLDRWERTRWGVWAANELPVRLPDAASYDDAVRAATELLVTERANTRWGLFGRHQGRVDAFAVRSAEEGFDLLRVNVPLDAFEERVPGSMFPGQVWTVDPSRTLLRSGDARREDDAVLALVGATRTIDLRDTEPSGPTEPFHAQPR